MKLEVFPIVHAQHRSVKWALHSLVTSEPYGYLFAVLDVVCSKPYKLMNSTSVNDLVEHPISWHFSPFFFKSTILDHSNSLESDASWSTGLLSTFCVLASGNLFPSDLAHYRHLHCNSMFVDSILCSPWALACMDPCEFWKALIESFISN